jgi:hypothetical protein
MHSIPSVLSNHQIVPQQINPSMMIHA